jgi:hypothetical protein
MRRKDNNQQKEKSNMKSKEEIIRSLVFYGFDVKIEAKHHHGGHWTTEFKGTFDTEEEFDKAFIKHCEDAVHVCVMDAAEVITQLVEDGRFDRIAAVSENVENGETVWVEGFGHVDHETYVKPSDAPDILEVCRAWFGHDYQATHMTVSARVGCLDDRDYEYAEKDVDISSITKEDVLDAAAEDYMEQNAEQLTQKDQ